MANKKTAIALMYDFDKTLCTKDMQEYGFISNMGMTSGKFWAETDELMKTAKMDSVLAYMYMMIKKSNQNEKSIHREDFVELGKSIEYFEGVDTWFRRINEYGKAHNVMIEHYIISSGIKEIIEGSSIGKEFKEIYACEFLYDHNGIAVWPKTAVNFTEKTQYLFRINKGVLDVTNNSDLNKYTPEDERRIPFRNMIYIGDGFTDVPCMKLTKANGGHSIAVYAKRKKQTSVELLTANRVDFVAEANYSQGGELEKIVFSIIDEVIAHENLMKLKSKK